MLRSAKSMRGYSILAQDGDIGNIHEFYFDDLVWKVRYLVVDTGGWLTGRKVLLLPEVLDRPDWETKTLSVALTQAQVESSPPIDTDRPVSRQMETEVHTYYGRNPYWRGGLPLSGLGAAAAAEVIAMGSEQRGNQQEHDPRLRSTREVIGYRIQGRDGEVGHVDDFVVDDETWSILYMVIDTGNWLPGRKVLIAPAWAEQVSWSDRKVYLGLKRETIQKGPEFDPSMPVNREYEARLYDYYGRPKYWD
jgi:hypothetical protein